jgi:hypothetical protein
MESMNKKTFFLVLVTLPFSSLVYSACVEPQIDAYGQVSPFSVLAHTICLSKERKAERERNQKRLRQEQQEQDAWKREQEVRDIQLEVKRLKLQRELDQLNNSSFKDNSLQKPPPIALVASQTAELLNQIKKGKTMTGDPNFTFVNAYSFKDSLVMTLSHKLTMQDIKERMSIANMEKEKYSVRQSKLCKGEMLYLIKRGFSSTVMYISNDGIPLYQNTIALKDCI